MDYPLIQLPLSSSLDFFFVFSITKIRPCVLPGNTFALTSSVFFSVRGQAEKKHLFSQLELSLMNKYVNICVGLLGRFITAVQRSSGVEVSACISLNSLDAAAAYDDDDDEEEEEEKEKEEEEEEKSLSISLRPFGRRRLKKT